MKITNTQIRIQNNNPSGIILIEKGDKIENCDIQGGEIKSATRALTFLDCVIDNCQCVQQKGVPNKPSTLVHSCTIKNCKLPKAYYSRNYITQKE